MQSCISGWFRLLRWPIGVMFAAHCTIAPLHKPATSQTDHLTNLPVHKPATSQTCHFTNRLLHYRLSLRSRAGLAAACYNMIVYVHAARMYTGQVTRLCMGKTASLRNPLTSKTLHFKTASLQNPLTSKTQTASLQNPLTSKLFHFTIPSLSTPFTQYFL